MQHLSESRYDSANMMVSCPIEVMVININPGAGRSSAARDVVSFFARRSLQRRLSGARADGRHT